MDYLERLPRRVFTLYLPLAVFLFVLLFPFYWMTTTTFKPDEELYDYARFNPFWVPHPTLAHVEKLFFETSYPSWLINTMVISVAATVISLFCSVCAAYAIERLRFSGARYVGLAIFLAYLVPPSILFIPLAAIIFKLGLFDSDWALILTYPTFLVPFCTWLLMGYFRTIPYELEECALIDGATRLQILWKITLPLAVPGLISAGIFAFTLSWNEFIYALTFISSSENKTVPVGAITELVEGDVYHWGSLMAAALFGSLPVVIMYSFFVEYYVSSLTGAVKEYRSTDEANAGRFLIASLHRGNPENRRKAKTRPRDRGGRAYIAIASFVHFLTNEVIAAPCSFLSLACHSQDVLSHFVMKLVLAAPASFLSVACVMQASSA